MEIDGRRRRLRRPAPEAGPEPSTYDRVVDIAQNVVPKVALGLGSGVAGSYLDDLVAEYFKNKRGPGGGGGWEDTGWHGPDRYRRADNSPFLAEGIDQQLDDYRDMRGPLPDIGRTMEDAARQLGLPPVTTPEPNPWIAQMNDYPDFDPGMLDDYPTEAIPVLNQLEGGMTDPWEREYLELIPGALRPRPIEPITPEQLNMRRVPGPMMEPDPLDPGFIDQIGDVIAREGGHVPDSAWERDLQPRNPRDYSWDPDYGFPNPNANDVIGALGDLLQTPGFKIGLGGTAALSGLLWYLGQNALEEIVP